MTGEDDKSYPLESGENAEPATPPSLPEEEPDIVVSRGVEALPLEEVDLESLDLPDHSGEPQETQQFELEIEPESDYVKSLDVCPNCGKAMGKTRNLICLKCGFDLKTMKVIETKTGETTVEEVEAENEKPKPVSRRGRGDLWLPGGLAGFSTVFMLIGYAIGAAGLFPGESVRRIQGFFQEMGLLVIWSVCGLGGVYCFARLQERPMGHWQLVVTRVVGIVCTMRLATFFDVTTGSVEWTLEAILQIGIVTLTSIFFFRLKPRDAGMLIIISILIFLILYLLAMFMRLVVG